MAVAERLVDVPSQMKSTVLPRIPMPEGGRRLIGLMTDTLRVYNGCRRHVQRGWLQEYARPYHYATAGQ
eukprot:5092930-Pyramimonas_sp.AAC.1